MQTSFTDFKLSFSIDNTSNDTEYVNIMSGVLRELYTTFGIALLRDLENNTETINLEHNIETKLIHKNIKSLTISGTLGTYIEGTDYTVNYEDGTITSLSIGSITNNESVTITYEYYVFINESNTLSLEIFPLKDKLIYDIGLNPFTINSVTYLNETLTEDTDYYIYNNKFELETSPTNLRKPFILDLNIGFDTLPNDLKMAFYELIKLRYDRRKAKADAISRVQDAEGSETTYRESEIPKHLANIFYAYAGFKLTSVY